MQPSDVSAANVFLCFLIKQSYVHFGSFQQKTQLSVYQMYINNYIEFLNAVVGRFSYAHDKIHCLDPLKQPQTLANL